MVYKLACPTPAGLKTGGQTLKAFANVSVVTFVISGEELLVHSLLIYEGCQEVLQVLENVRA